MALYGAPVWADKVKRVGIIRKALREFRQRRLAGRVIKYKTTSFAASTALAEMPPLEFGNVFEKIARLKREKASVISTAGLS